MGINLKQNFFRVSFICPVYVWNFRLLKGIDFNKHMVTSDMQRVADLPSRCCFFNNCVQFTTFYMQRFTTVLRKMQTSIFVCY